MKKAFYFLVILGLIVGGYAYWCSYDRITTVEKIYPRYVIGNLQQIGSNHGKGNIIGLSPYLHTVDFSSEDAYFNMLHYYLDFAKRKNLLNDSTILILPEYIGTWLIAANEKSMVYKDSSIEDDSRMIVYSNPIRFIKAYLRSSSKDKFSEAVFRMKAEKMLSIYQHTFSKLAKEFKITIVAGSIVLPDPAVENGKMKINASGKLYNVSAVFDASGNIQPALAKKIFPIQEEKNFTCAAGAVTIPIFKTPAGNMAVLICADAWYPECYQSIKNEVDILAVPAFVAGSGDWDQKWKGYNGAPRPADVNKNDIGKITEQQAWMKYAMCGRASDAGIKYGVITFLRGDLWDIGTHGQTIVWNHSCADTKETGARSGTLINVWLE